MNLLIRADASADIGTGHVMRCLALAQSWLQATDNQVTFLMATAIPAIEARLRQEGAHVSYLSTARGSQEDAAKTIDCAKSLAASWVVVDGYQFDDAYQKTIKVSGLKLLFLDDYGHTAHYWADLVLNQNVSAGKAFYASRESYTKLLLGSQYALLRKEFWEWQYWQRQIPKIARKVLVTLGGADPDNTTLKVIEALQQVEIEDLEVIVVVGGNNLHYEALWSAAQLTPKMIALKRNVTNMPELMAWADVCVSAGGSTCWELLFMGLPSLVITIAENQRQAVALLHARKALLSIGWYETIKVNMIAYTIVEIISSQSRREAISSQAQQIIDGQGASRVLEHLNG